MSYFEYTGGREGDHAVTMCIKVDSDIYRAQRMDFDSANKAGQAGAIQCEELESGAYINHNHIEVTPICYRENSADAWQTGWTTPVTGHEAWNYGKADNVAHAYQSTVMPLAASECQEPVTMQHTAAAQHIVLPAVGMGYYDYIFAAVLSLGMVSGWLMRSVLGSAFGRIFK